MDGILTLKQVKGRLRGRGAVLQGDHVVLTPKLGGFYHASGYFNKDEALRNSRDVLAIANEFARRFAEVTEVIVGPTVGAVGLISVTAVRIMEMTGREIIWAYADEDQETVEVYPIIGDRTLGKRKIIVPTKSKRVLRRGFPKDVKGRQVIVLEDVFSSGGSAEVTIAAVREVGGNVVGVGVICNRSGLTADDLGVPKLEVLWDIPMVMHREEKCPLCADLIPINMQVGHGADFYARHPNSDVPRNE